MKKLSSLKVGDAFKFEGKVYIAFSLTPDPLEVYCLDVETKQLEEIYEGEKVEPLLNWNLVETKDKVKKKRSALDVL